jgi:hypothetical protein
MDNQKIIILLSLLVVLLVTYKMILSYESFEQLDICDYDSPNPSSVCKGIKKGCTHLIKENSELNKNINDNCTMLPTDTRDLINTAINCDNTVNKLIMNKYVQKEVCSQIINFPTEEKTLLTPSDNQFDETSNPQLDNTFVKTSEPTYKPNDTIFGTAYFLDTAKGFSSF